MKAKGIECPGRQPGRRRRADRSGAEAAGRRRRATAAGGHGDVRDERQLCGSRARREPAHGGRVPGEPEGDRRGPAPPRDRADPDDRAALGRGRPAERARREPERPPRALHGGVPRGRPRSVASRWSTISPAGPTRNRRGSRSATGRPTAATRTRRGTASSPTRCCPCSSRRSGPTRDPSRSRPGSTPCSSTTTASSSGITRGATAIPAPGGKADPGVLMTLAEAPAHLRPLLGPERAAERRPGPDLGRARTPSAELDWVREPGGSRRRGRRRHARVGTRRSGKVLAVGAQVRYSPKGEQLEDRPRSNQTAYAVFDPKSGRWTRWRRLEMPADDDVQLRPQRLRPVRGRGRRLRAPAVLHRPIGRRALRRHGRRAARSTATR